MCHNKTLGVMLKAFSSCNNYVVHVLESIYVANYTYWFTYVVLPLRSWDETDFFLMDDVFDMFLHLVCEYFKEYICISVHKGNWSEVLFVCSLCGLSVSIIVAS